MSNELLDTYSSPDLSRYGPNTLRLYCQSILFSQDYYPRSGSTMDNIIVMLPDNTILRVRNSQSGDISALHQYEGAVDPLQSEPIRSLTWQDREGPITKFSAILPKDKMVTCYATEFGVEVDPALVAEKLISSIISHAKR